MLTKKQRERRASWNSQQKRRHEKRKAKKLEARIAREAEMVEYLNRSGWTKGRESWAKPDWDLDKERKYLTKDGKPPEGISPMTCYATLHQAVKIQMKLDSVS
jgi:hypothetical protein